MILNLKRSKSSVALILQHGTFTLELSQWFYRKPIAIYSSQNLVSHSCREVASVFKRFAVIGVFDSAFFSPRRWGENFEFVATCFYTTGFRPLLINFLGTPNKSNLPFVFRTLIDSYTVGLVEEPVFDLTRSNY